MDAHEVIDFLTKDGERVSKLLEEGTALFQSEDYLAAIKVLTKAIELGSKLKYTTDKINLPPEMKKIYIKELGMAYLMRSASYLSIGEKEKGAADMAMSEKIVVEMESYNSPDSNNIAEKKEPAPQSTSSISSTNVSDYEIKNLEEVLKTSMKPLNLGNYYLQKSNYAMAIREFTRAIKLVSQARDSAYRPGFPSEITKACIANLRAAYIGRAISYNAIDEKEKGAADTAMAKEFEAEMKNYDPPASNHISEKKEPAPQPTYSSSNTNSGDDFSTSKVLFWFAIFIFIVAALVASFTGISLGTSLLLTVVGIVALIIWLGR